MRTTSLSYRWLPKALPASLLVALSMPAHSVWIDTPNVRDGLQLGIFTTVNPQITHTSNKFDYTLGDPAIYGANGTYEQVAADQDRQDADRRLRAEGVNDASVQFAARQVLTKDLTARGSVLLGYTQDGNRNYGALWGVGLDIDRFGSITVGDEWTRLPVRQTDVNNIIQFRGTNAAIEYTGIPNLTVSGYHMFAATSDVRDRRDGGWHRSNGVSAEYEFDFAPRNKLTIAAGGAQSKGHENPFYVNHASKNDAYLVGIGYEYQDLKLGFDYGEAKAKYNDLWAGTINTKVYGVKASYEFTPRLTGTVSYAHKTDDNSKPINLQFLINNRFTVNNSAAFPTFDKTKQDRYRVGLDYQLYKGLRLSASLENQITTNYVVEGEFSERNRLHAAVGASLSF